MLTGNERGQLEAQWNSDDLLIASFAWLVRIAVLPIVVVALLWIAVTGERDDNGQ